MIRPHLLLAVLGCALLGGCDGAAESKAAAATRLAAFPTIDASTPEALVRTYWALEDWQQKSVATELRIVVSPELQKYFDARVALSGGDFRVVADKELKTIDNPFDPPEFHPVLAREIVTVKKESATRAVVVTKIVNVTPLPANIKLDEGDRVQRAYGEDVQYVVEKIGGEWRLMQALYRRYPDTEQWEKRWEAKKESTLFDGYRYVMVER